MESVYLQYMAKTYRVSWISVEMTDWGNFIHFSSWFMLSLKPRQQPCALGSLWLLLCVFTETEDVWPLSPMSDSELVRTHLWKNTNSSLHPFWFKHKPELQDAQKFQTGVCALCVDVIVLHVIGQMTVEQCSQTSSNIDMRIMRQTDLNLGVSREEIEGKRPETSGNITVIAQQSFSLWVVTGGL